MLSRFRRGDQGAELIEFTIVFPILMMILGGIMDFGMMLRNYEVVTNAAREGARVAILEGYAEPDVEARIDEYLAAAGLDGDRDVALEPVPVTTSAGVFTAQAVTLTYTYQFAMLSVFAPFFGGEFGTVSLEGISVMRSETQAAPAP